MVRVESNKVEVQLIKFFGWDQKVSQISDHDVCLWTSSQKSATTVFLLADEDDLHDVISTVTGLAGRWQDLGSSLRLRSGDLDAILSASAHSPSDCLRKMLTLWLRQSYNVCITLICIRHPQIPPGHNFTLPLSTICSCLIRITIIRENKAIKKCM